VGHCRKRNRSRDQRCTYKIAYHFYPIDGPLYLCHVPVTQFGRRVEDRIRDLLKHALATDHPAPTILSELQKAIIEYRVVKAQGQRLCGQRSDDLTLARSALSIPTIQKQIA
jgi:hypothetical protein